MELIAHGTDTAADGSDRLQVANDADLAALAAQGAFEGVARIELEFPVFTDGRAFSQAVLLRRRYGFKGDLRATGDVLIDQLVQMQRSGFSSAVLASGIDATAAARQFARYSAFYQGDVLEPRPHFARHVVRELEAEAA